MKTETSRVKSSKERDENLGVTPRSNKIKGK